MKKVNLGHFCFLVITVIVHSSCSHLEYWPKNIKSTTKMNDSFFHAAWSKNLDPVFDSGNLPIALQSPLVEDGIVYVGDNKGYMNAYELENGREVWRVFDDSTIHSTPSAYKDLIIYGTAEGRIIARKAKNGDEVVYNVDVGSPIETAGTIFNGKIFFQLRNHQVFCLDAETGKIIWGFKKSVSYLTTLQHASTPIVYKNKVLVGFADGTLGALSIEEGLLLYEVKLSQASKFLDVDSTPFIFDDKIYISPQGSSVAMIEPNTGKIIRRGDFSTLRSPIVYKDQLIFGTNLGEVVICDKNLNILKIKKLSTEAITSIILFKDKLVFGNLKGEVVATDLTDLHLIDKFEFGHSYSAIFSEIVSKEDRLVVLSSRNRLFTFF